jgi:hypothetical protein
MVQLDRGLLGRGERGSPERRGKHSGASSIGSGKAEEMVGAGVVKTGLRRVLL